MTINPPIFSIITVTKNNLAGLKATQASIEHQSCKNFEWIVIDGNSDDGTKEHITTLNAKAISENDTGIYNAMNKGLDLAIGQYVIFMNAGDAFADADILSTLSRAIKSQNPDFIYSDALETNGLYKKSRHHTRIEWGMFTHHQAMIYRNSPIRYDETFKIASDYGFTTEHLKKALNIHYIPCAICIFEDGGISQQRRKLGRQEQFNIRKNKEICSPFKNRMIYTVQSFSAFLREKLPPLYFYLKRYPTIR